MLFIYLFMVFDMKNPVFIIIYYFCDTYLSLLLQEKLKHEKLEQLSII